MLKVILIVLIVVLGVSLYGNFSLLKNNLDLQGQYDLLTSKNSELSSQITSLDSKIAVLEAKQQPSTIVLPEKQDPDSKSQSIRAVAIRPVLVRDGFFQNILYEGTIMNIELSTRQGTGLVLVNTAIPTGVDFQSSAKTAVKVAEDYLHTDLSSTDIIFSITADQDEKLQAVDGQSAGAAMAVLLIASLQEKKLNDNVIMTGTINPDMSIGMVGGISQKADAAGRHGASIFLVPSKQGVTFVEKCTENRTGNFVYRSCSSEQKPLSPLTEEKYEMKTIEVASIKDALLYFSIS